MTGLEGKVGIVTGGGNNLNLNSNVTFGNISTKAGNRTIQGNLRLEF